jgi:hypothetical protein
VAARSTRLRVVSEILFLPFIAFDAVVRETPASRATCVSVAGRVACMSPSIGGGRP